MKKHLFFTLILVNLIISDLSTYGQFIKQYPNILYELNSIYFKNINEGWSVGNNGTIIYTIDGGSNWIPQISPTVNNLHSITFSDSLHGWIVGDGGIVVRSSDGGQTWAASYIGTSENLNSIFFLSNIIGWTCGYNGSIYKTSNGGLSWTQKVTSTSDTLIKIFFIDPNTGWAAGNYKRLLKTTDGGNTWNTLSCCVGGQPYSYYTNNWDWSSIQFLDINNGYAAIKNGTVWKTTDGGLNWNNAFSFSGVTAVQINDLHFIDTTYGYAVGGLAQFNYVPSILKTTNSGNTWTSIVLTPYPVNTTGTFNSIAVVDSENIWVAGVTHGNTIDTAVIYSLLYQDLKLTSTPPNTMCIGGYYCLNYITQGKFNSDNKFELVISDGYDNFSSKTILDSNLSLSGTFCFTLPALPHGSNFKYRIRVEATDPAYYSQDNGFDIMIDQPAGDFYAAQTLLQCPSSTVQLTNNNWQYPNENYSWNFGDTSVFLINNTQTVYHTYQCNGLYDILMKVTDLNSCSNIIAKIGYINVTNCTCTYGINEISSINKNELNIYPNPTTNNLTIETNLNREQRLEITNLIGQTVYTTIVNKKAIINTSAFPSGVYILKLSSDKETVVRKFVKE